MICRTTPYEIVMQQLCRAINSGAGYCCGKEQMSYSWAHFQYELGIINFTIVCPVHKLQHLYQLRAGHFCHDQEPTL